VGVVQLLIQCALFVASQATTELCLHIARLPVDAVEPLVQCIAPRRRVITLVDVRVDAVRLVLDASFDLFGTAQRCCVRIPLLRRRLHLLLHLLRWRWRRGHDAAHETKGGRGRESALKSFVHRMIQGQRINRSKVRGLKYAV
jgi:hypothetical protein